MSKKLITTIVSFIILLGGIIAGSVTSQRANNHFEGYLKTMTQATDLDTKISLADKAISGIKKAGLENKYNGLLKTYDNSVNVNLDLLAEYRDVLIKCKKLDQNSIEYSLYEYPLTYADIHIKL